MPRRETMAVSLTIRIPLVLRDAFNVRAREHGIPAEILRELIEGYVTGQFRVPSEENKGEVTYVARKLD